MTFKHLTTLLALSITALGGCYGGADAGEAPVNGATTEESTSSRAWENFVGAWAGDSGSFHGLVITRTPEGHGHHWFADIDTGVRCIRAPCPQAEGRAEGVFTATSRTLTLGPSDPRLGASVGVFGAYTYSLRGDSLALSQGGRVVARLHKVTSYCGDVDDCHEQSLITPRCVGYFTCTTDSACAYHCGRPAAGEGQTCAGIAGIQCADGLTCVMNGTYPDAGGICRRPIVTTCLTARCTATTHCVDSPTGARCVANGPSCATMRCAIGYTCQDTDGVGACVPQVVRCGTSTCAPGLYCCNPLRNLCAPPGVACIQ